MGIFTDAINRIFRDYEADGIAASGLNEVEKSDARTLGPLLDQAIGGAVAGIGIVATTADRDTFFANTANQSKLVYVNNNNGSATDPANGVYEYVGGAARIAQGFYAALADVVQPLVDDAEDAAEQSQASAESAQAAADGVSDLSATITAVSETYRPDPTIRTGWAGMRQDADGRVISRIRRSSGVEYTYIPQSFLRPVEITEHVFGGSRIQYIKLSPRSGFLAMWQDADGRLLAGIRTNGDFYVRGSRVITEGLSLRSQRFNGTRIEYVGLSPRSGYVAMWQDAAGRMLAGIRNTGDLVSRGRRVLTEADLGDIGTPETPTYRIYEALDKAGKAQVFRQELATGGVTRLSPEGSNNQSPVVSAEGTHVFYRTDRAGMGLRAVPLAGGTERPVSPLAGRLTVVGDSLTYGQGASDRNTTSWAALVAASFGLTLTNFGWPGFASTSVAAMLAAVPITLTVSGNTIAGAGAVTAVAAISCRPLTQHNGTGATDGGTRTIIGTLLGQQVTLRRYATGSAGAYTDNYEVVSAAGSAGFACPAGSLFIPTQYTALKDELFTVCLGTNVDGESDATVSANIDAIIAQATPIYPRFIVIGLFRPNSKNTAWRAQYPINYALDDLGRDAAQRLAAFNDGSATDLADVAAGRIPTSLTVDGTHLNDAGQVVISGLITQFLNRRGWAL